MTESTAAGIPTVFGMPGHVPPAVRRVQTTGRYKVIFRRSVSAEAAVDLLRARAGVRAADARDFTARAAPESGGGVVLPALKAAIVDLDPDQFKSLGTLSVQPEGGIVAVSPELVLYATHAMSPDYVRGFRDGLNMALAGPGGVPANLLVPAPGDTVSGIPSVGPEADHTWGRQITRAITGKATGRGVRVAVLDTGLARAIPDTLGASITAESFVPGEQDVEDTHGHGTHCAGTVCGPAVPAALPCFGVAPDVDLYVGKVLSAATGEGDEGWILDGLDWAIRNRCDIVSMSLGAWVPRGWAYDAAFEALAKRALEGGVLIVAAAGNDSARPNRLEPVNHPANCPSVMAVAALTLASPGASPVLTPSEFSNAGLDPNSEVNVAAPGDNVLSSWPHPPFTRRLRGTSMATPHVAGIAALWAEASGVRGRALWDLLLANAIPLPQPAADVGRGLVAGP